MVDPVFWKAKKVFVTGHTGFKGSWLCMMLKHLGAVVTGYALDPPTIPSLFDLCGIGKTIEKSVLSDIRNCQAISASLADAAPEIVFHLAAQPIVRDSYKNPVETYSVNVMGTVHLLEAVRMCPSVRSVVVVTTDKCYENREWVWGYRENDALGGYDPYSNSKACAELLSSAYRDSFFNPSEYDRSHRTSIATARAGNVIGGGDWASDRLVPDCVRALLGNETIKIRNPKSVRPWQHVLDPLTGYLVLAQKLCESGGEFSGAWNFGPGEGGVRTVEWIVKELCRLWGGNARYASDQGHHPHETNYLKLDCSKAHSMLSWRPVWEIGKALEKTVEWTRAYVNGKNLYEVCISQLEEYGASANRAG